MRLRHGVELRADYEFLLRAIQATMPDAGDDYVMMTLADLASENALFVGVGDPYELGVLVRVEDNVAVLSHLYSERKDRNSFAVWSFFREIVRLLRRNGIARIRLAVTSAQPKAHRTMNFYARRLGFQPYAVVFDAPIEEVARRWEA